MEIAPLILDMIAVAIVSFLFLSRYISIKNNHLAVLIVTYISWYFSFLILFLLPLDVSNTFYRQCLHDANISSNATTTTTSTTTTTPATPPNSTDSNIYEGSNTTSFPSTTTIAIPPPECSEPLIGAPKDVLYIIWQVVYWSSQILTWILLPGMQGYATAGDFTILGKIKYSLFSNAIIYGTFLLLAGVFLIVLVAKGFAITGASLYIIAVAASNTWGLFCLIFLLGYGLVEVPRVCWRRGDVRMLLREAYFKVAKLSLDKSDAEDELTEIAEVIKRTSSTVNSAHADLIPYMRVMEEKLPESITSRLTRRGAAGRSRDSDFLSDADLLGELSMKTLVKIHKKLIQALHRYTMTNTRWVAAVARSLHYEDTVNSLGVTGFYHRTNGVYDGFLKLFCTPTVEWYWECLAKPWLFRILACVLAVLSLFVVWSEVVFWCSDPVLSLYAIFIDEAQQNHAFVALELISAATVAYLSVCAYFTIFKVRILSYYHLSPYHNTDENSLTFSGLLLCRFTPALCLNYLSLIHLEKSVNPDMVERTAYSRIMGDMTLLPFISSGFNIYFPISILLLCLATIFSLGSRLLHAFGFQQFVGDDDMTNELVEEGRLLISRERGYMDRAARRDERRKELENLGVFPRGSDGSDGATAVGGDWSTRHRRNYTQPESINSGGISDLESGNATSTSVGSVGTNSFSNDRSQLLTGPLEPPVYMQGNQGLGRPSNTQATSRNLFDDI